MIKNIVKFLLNAVAIYATAYILTGVNLSSFYAAIIVALVLALLNMFVKPILIIFSLPINILTLGLFTFVIDALIVLLASSIVTGFEIVSFWTAILFSIVMSVISYVLHKLIV